jgi:hypothetical protein
MAHNQPDRLEIEIDVRAVGVHDDRKITISERFNYVAVMRSYVRIVEPHCRTLGTQRVRHR